MCGIVAYIGDREACPIILKDYKGWSIVDMTVPVLRF
jgi:hypothetical protein